MTVGEKRAGEIGTCAVFGSMGIVVLGGVWLGSGK